MPTSDIKHVKDLTLDRKNFRTLPQSSELSAIKAMLAIDPKAFWEIMESLLDDGYLTGENILLLGPNGTGGNYIVREGNQRVAAIKIALGLLKPSGIDVPSHIQSKIDGMTPEIEAAIERVPCSIYSPTEEPILDKIVARTHGKGQKASRTGWNAVATARHNRDEIGGSEAGLDLLEEYLKKGDNLTNDEKALWAGKYGLRPPRHSIADMP